MRSRSPSIVPPEANQDTYLVLDDFGGRLGRAWRETDEEGTDRETLWIQSEDFKLSAPLRGGIAKSLDSDAARQAAFDRCSDEIRRDPRPAPTYSPKKAKRPPRYYSAPTTNSTIKIVNPITRIITSPVTRRFADSVMAETLHGAVV